jgi:TonB family protein
MGGFMPGVTVRARATSGVERTGSTDDAGRYVIAGVPPGEYAVRFAHSGFRTFVATQVLVRDGAEAVVNARLDIGSVSEAIHVTQQAGVPPPVDTASLLAQEAQLLRQLGQTPDDAAVHLALAQVYYRLERLAESEAAMRRAADLIGRRAAARRADYTVTLPRGGVVKEPRKIRDVKPIYPEIARTARVVGTVILEARIGEDGTVRDARILRSVPLLDQAALGAVRQWLFTPTLLNGVPIEVVITATVTFNLRDLGVR